jgi:3-deoxy-D-manno-octulosonic-acid transferase
VRFIYTLILYALVPWILLRLVWRTVREPGYLDFLGERFGSYRRIASAPLIWVHAVSVGETRAAQPLVEALLQQYPDHYLLITHMTPTGREAGREIYGGSVERCYLPYDLPGAVKEFLDHWSPQLGILMETEIWPNLIHGCNARGIPIYLVNGRMSTKSLAGYRRLSGLTRSSLRGLAAVAAQSAQDAERFIRLGAREVSVTGSLKFDVTVAQDQVELGLRWRRLYGAGRPVLLAASTREDEEELIVDQLKSIAVPDLLTVIVPRHRRRFDSVAALVEGRGFKVQRRSEDAAIAPATQVVIGDSMGEMFAYYAACDVAFIGGSLLPFGAHNLIEACAAGKPVLIGPSVYNFASAVREAEQVGAAIKVRNAKELAREAARLLLDREAAQRMGATGLEFCAGHRGATRKVMELIKLKNG